MRAENLTLETSHEVKSMQLGSLSLENVQLIAKFDRPGRVEKWVMDSEGERLTVEQKEALGSQKMLLSWYGHQYLGR